MRILADGLRYPEGPIALSDGSVLLVEIERQTLSKVSPDGQIQVMAEVPGGPNGAAIGPDGRIYICNNGGMTWIREGNGTRPGHQSADYRTGSIDAVNLTTGQVDRLYDKCGDLPLRGPNDLIFDNDGGFWFTDYGKRRAREMDLGYIYWARADGSEIRQVAEGLLTPNGIGLSPDEKTLYVSETATGRIWSWDIIGPGELRKAPWPANGGARLVAGLGGCVRFDGMAVTAEGNICVAALDARAVFEVSPSGELVKEHEIPDMLVTNICFGGPQMRTAFITLSHQGRLVTLDWSSPGLQLAHHR
ncbi:SMP-30/gluconolactonase/LRE family protein [Rhizobium leguminosarum]|uniref:SMP-30/gluconolactonase/LRE family protein n=1 Tax=Rhizobium leguminosarum TaxID=384 RepID=UPI001C98089F|nr:SMP-30/gluconolactonase/LRE family protein [Rhizobium leguminosarum]MBY5406768.1 SMP-30/gluconolactonase/LRE family protein [Rhizobium leguminosarum]